MLFSDEVNRGPRKEKEGPGKFFPKCQVSAKFQDNKDKRDEENLRCNNRSRIVSRGCAARCLVVDKKDTKADHDFSFF
jgi:hypothetical protein